MVSKKELVAVSVRMDKELVRVLRVIANSKGISYQKLINQVCGDAVSLWHDNQVREKLEKRNDLNSVEDPQGIQPMDYRDIRQWQD